MLGFFQQFEILQMFQKGGPVMWPLLFVSILGLAFIFERFWHYHRVTINTPDFLDKIRKVLRQRKVKEAIQVCENYRGPIASILKAGLLKFGKQKEEVEKAIDNSGAIEMSRLERGLIWIATVSTIAPLLGFLGTVTGMIKAFDTIATQGMNNPALVALGISEALITTATGLAIAIPMSLAYNYFSNRVGKLVLEMEESSGMLLEFMNEMSQEDSAKA
ncbi:MotA/TolQ/ExbB proton channel family protein [bacterium]|nr:MotA/TolQ/ExbB proton channel family protein [candidate division CSSED10-310 bacterium]